jgi:hypothetical protein
MRKMRVGGKLFSWKIVMQMAVKSFWQHQLFFCMAGCRKFGKRYADTMLPLLGYKVNGTK